MSYTHYRQVDAAADKLYAQEKYEEALALLQDTLNQFPEYWFNNLSYQAFLFRNTGQYEKGYEIAETLIQQGYFFPIEGELELLKQKAGFASLQEENERLKAKAQAQARMEYAVYLPEGYIESKRYPLFFVLHGDGGNANLEQFPWYWPSEAVTRLGFVSVYVQSSQVLAYRNFGWLSDPQIARRDIKNCYEMVVSQFAVDPGMVIVGGFSGGAITAIDIALTDALPVRGFVCQSPEIKPASFTVENVRRAAQRGIRGVFMEGAKVIPVPDEQEMMQAFQDAGLPYQFYVNPGVGHVIPEDLAEKLRQAVDFINH
jgi:predicted esterase